MRRSGLYIETPEWLKNKKAIINPKNKDDNCLQYAVPVALDHEDIGKNPQRISKIRLFITKYNLDGIEAPAGPKDWKKFEQNNKTIAFNILYVSHNTEQIYCAYKSKYNNERENQVILLMITDSKRSDGVKKWHYLP